MNEGETKKNCCHTQTHLSKIGCHLWLQFLALSVRALFISSLPVSALLLHNRKHIMAELKSIIPQGLGWITPPCSSLLTIASCARVFVCVFRAIIAWPFLQPLLPIDCENRLGLIIHKKNSGSFDYSCCPWQQDQSMRRCACVRIHFAFVCSVRITVDLQVVFVLKCVFYSSLKPQLRVQMSSMLRASVSVATLTVSSLMAI